ncbi:MAG: M20 aminoacylase family protein [Pseudomonadota bacterium]
MPVLNRIAEFQDEMTAWRKHLHAHPEMGYETVETAAFVADRLREFGVDEIHTGVAENGLVALIHGQGTGPVVGLRADMDALPIQEVNDLPHKSTVPGKMHACGHDGHTAILMGAAKYLSETRNFRGTVALMFQPAEEGGGGALRMVEEGVLDRFDIDQVFALHNWPGLPQGSMDMNPGPAMAAADKFDIQLVVNGAHAAWPHKSVDAIFVGSLIVQALQSIVARTINPREEVVLSITQFQAGNTHNVIPTQAELKGTVRVLNEDLRVEIADRIEKIVTGLAAAHGAEVVFDYEMGYPVTVNDPQATEFALGAARDVFGANATMDHIPAMGAEDFSYMLQHRPGAYVFLGHGDGPALHHPEYDFDDSIAPLGASFFARLVERGAPVVP